MTAKLNLAAFGSQRGIVCSACRRNLSAARYIPRRTTGKQRRNDLRTRCRDARPNDNCAHMQQAPTAERSSAHVPRKPAPCSIWNVARHRMQLPQTEHIRSALRPLAAQPEISTDTAAAQDDAMGVPIDNGARMPLRSCPLKPAPCSIRISARHRMPHPQTESIRSALRPSPHG